MVQAEQTIFYSIEIKNLQTVMEISENMKSAVLQKLAAKHPYMDLKGSVFTGIPGRLFCITGFTAFLILTMLELLPHQVM